jgi:hypothetical protein
VDEGCARSHALSVAKCTNCMYHDAELGLKNASLWFPGDFCVDFAADTLVLYLLVTCPVFLAMPVWMPSQFHSISQHLTASQVVIVVLTQALPWFAIYVLA